MKRTGFQDMSIWRYPFYIMLHPIDGFQELRFNKKGSSKVTAVILMLWLAAELLYRSVTDYDLNPFNAQNLSFLRVSLITVLMFVMACVSNWCFCSLLDGKGRMKDIFVVGAYGLLPYVIVRFLCVLLSYFFSMDEQILLNYSVIVIEVWCFFIILLGLKEIHEYSMKKTILSLVLTLVGIIIMVFLALLVITLFQQLLVFVMTVGMELMY